MQADLNPGSSAARREAARRLLIDAVALFKRASSIWSDEEDVEDGIEIVYAVDADVIQMYANPQRNEHYGAVFEGAEDVDLLVTSLLGEHIFHRPFVGLAPPAYNSHKSPLVLLPPHRDEFNAHVLKYSDDYAKPFIRGPGNSALRERLKADLSTIDLASAEDGLVTFLTDRASDLVKVLFGQSGAAAPMAQLRRVTRALLADPMDHPAFNGPDALACPPTRDAFGQAADDVAARADVLFDLMQADDPRGAKARERNFDKDAWVLASVEWVNEDAASRGLGKRLVLVSGTPRLLEIRRARASIDGDLRDPRAFMGLRDFFAPQSESAAPTATFRLREWLDIFFPESIAARLSDFEGRGSIQRPREADFQGLEALIAGNNLDYGLDILLEGKSQDGVPFPDYPLKQWRDVVTVTYGQRMLARNDDEALKELRHLLGAKPEEIDTRIEEVIARLSDRAAKAFAGLYLATGVIGVEQLLDQKVQIRGLPALRFDGRLYPEAQKQYDALSDELFKKLRPKSFDLRRMYDELTTVEGSHYHAHVIHAYVYASAARWKSARTLCRVALVVANAQPVVAGQLKNGREAAFFLAIAERRLARDEKGFQQAADALSLARERDETNSPEDVRFTSEALAQSMVKWQFAYFRREACDPKDLPRFLAQAVAIGERVVNSMTPEPRGVRAWVVRQAVTNGLVAALLAVDSGRWNPQVTGAARTLIELLEAECLAPPLNAVEGVTIYQDGMSDFVWLVAVVRFDTARALVAKDKLSSCVPPARSSLIVPFEQERFARFMRLIGL